jgi:hypothetical protein
MVIRRNVILWERTFVGNLIMRNSAVFPGIFTRTLKTTFRDHFPDRRYQSPRDVLARKRPRGPQDIPEAARAPGLSIPGLFNNCRLDQKAAQEWGCHKARILQRTFTRFIDEHLDCGSPRGRLCFIDCVPSPLPSSSLAQQYGGTCRLQVMMCAICILFPTCRPWLKKRRELRQRGN